MSTTDKDTSCIHGGKKIAVLFTVGILFILAGITCYPLIDSLIQNKINSRLVLSPTSDSFKQWKSPNVPIYLQFFLFNVENKEEVMKGKKPCVTQKGPYSYREHRLKENITWDDKNATVTYNERQWFVYDTSTSCSSCDPFKDNITNLNIFVMTLADLIKKYPDILDWKELLNAILEVAKDNIFQTRTVQELLWGYQDPLLKAYQKYKKKKPWKFFNLPDLNPTIALQQNNTYQGITTVYTGAKDINLIEKWKNWKGKDNVGVWNTSYANMLNGSDGVQFPPQQTADSLLYVFVTQLCRSLYLAYDSPSMVHGINTLTFTTPSRLFLNATLNPDNRAFCTKKCYPSGILDIGVCQKLPFPLPIFISAPHFYEGDRSLTDNVHGLSPNKEEHGTILEVENHLGLPLKSAKRLQINVFMNSVKHMTETENLRSLFLPVLYINETATITSSLAKMIKNEVLTPINVAHYTELALIALGLILIIIALTLLGLLMNRNRKLKEIRAIMSPNIPTENSPLLVST